MPCLWEPKVGRSPRRLQLISYIPAEEDHHTAQLDKTQVVLSMVFMADQHAADVLPPGEPSLHVPAACVAPQRAAVLRLGSHTVGPRRCDQLDASLGQWLVEWIAIVGCIPDQMRRSSLDTTPGERGFNKGDLMRRSTRHVDGDRKTSTVCHGHDLRALAPLGRSSTSAPFWATTKVPSMKHSDRSMPPRSRRSVAKAWRIGWNTPECTHCCKRRWHVW
jgi:hypothetical protein